MIIAIDHVTRIYDIMSNMTQTLNDKQPVLIEEHILRKSQMTLLHQVRFEQLTPQITLIATIGSSIELPYGFLHREVPAYLTTRRGYNPTVFATLNVPTKDNITCRPDSSTNQRLQPVGQQFIVSITKVQPFPLRPVNPHIPGTTNTPVLLVNNPKPLVFFNILITNPSAIINRPVINKHTFPIAIRLSHNGV